MLERTTQPQTLIEKLEQLEMDIADLQGAKHGLNPFYLSGKVAGIGEAINIVKQHQTWRKMPSHEKPQDMQAYNLLLKTDSTEYPTLYHSLP